MRPSIWWYPGLLVAMIHAAAGCGQHTPKTSGSASGGAMGSGGAAGSGGATGSGGSIGSSGGATGSGGTSGPGGGAMNVESCSITSPTTWTAGVYVAKCNIEVTSALTIEPGVILRFGAGYALNVHPGGKLTAAGTESQPIIFTALTDDAHGGDAGGDGPTSASKNDWGCQGSCGDLNIEGSGSVLEYVQDLYGSNGVYVRADSVAIKSSTFAHHKTYGLVLDEAFSVESTALNGNAFFDNGGFPLRLGKAAFLNDSNVFHDPDHPSTTNGKQCVEIGSDIDHVVWLGVVELGFLFSGHRITAELLVPPGVIFKAQSATTYLDPSGTFVNGPNAIFTSYRDDAAGGDCTGDGASDPAEGDWQGLWIDDGNQADYAAPADYIRYAKKSGTMTLH